MKRIPLFLLFLLLHFLSKAQNIITLAGTGASGYGGDGGAAVSAMLYRPIGCVMDNDCNLYVTDFSNSRIRKISAAGIITTICGTGVPGTSGDGGPAALAQISNPEKITIDASGNLYFCDHSAHRVRKISAAGIITTIAGTGVAGYSGDGGLATAATLWYPGGIAVDATGNIYICDEWNNRVRKINTAGIITSVAGNGPTGWLAGGYSGDGGLATAAAINFPVGIAVSSTGDIIFADNGNKRVRKINSAGIISTVAGTGIAGFSGDGGLATAARISGPEGVAVDASGVIYICETGNNRVRKVDAAGIISTFAGTGVAGFTGDGGAATLARINFPEGIYVNPTSSCVYICDANNNRVRKIGTCNIDIQVNDTNICSGALPATLTAPAGYTAPLWSTGATTSSITITAAGTYWVKSEGNCSLSVDTFHVTLTPTVNNIITTDTTICATAFPALLSAPATFTSPVWSTGATSSAITISAPGTYWVRSSVACLLSADTFHVTATPFVISTITTDTTICTSAFPALLSAPSGYTSPVWSTGATSSTISVSSSGTYWVRSSAACSLNADTFHVSAASVIVNTTITDTAICTSSFPVSLIAPIGYSSPVWSTGATTSAITISVAGTYWVRSATGCYLFVDTFHVTTTPVSVSINTTDTAICTSAFPATLSVPSGYSAPIWSTGATTSSIIIPTVGTYWVRSNGPCSLSVDTFHVTMAPFVVTSIATDTAICSMAFPTTLSAPPGYGSPVWSTGATTLAITISSAGVYWIRGTNSCGLNVDTFHVIATSPTVIITTENVAACEGNTSVLAAPATFGSYTWNTGATSPSVTVNTGGNYWVTDTNLAACLIQSDTFHVNYSPLPIVSLGSDTSICEGQSITLSSPLSSGSYLWNTGSSNSSISIIDAGIYVLTVTSNFCSATDSIIINIISLPNIDLGADKALCDGSHLYLAAGLNAYWSTGVIATGINVTETGTYWAVATNQCGSTSDSVFVDFGACTVGVPTAFSPNGDGQNDILYVRGEGLTTISLKIYNRWGQLVFETSDQSKGWDGTFNGIPQSVETYGYGLNVSFIDGSVKTVKGNITLMR